MKKVALGTELVPKLKSYRRAVVALKLPRRIGNYINFVRKVILAFTNNPYIVNPVPSVQQVTTDADTLETKEAIALTRVMGGAANRDVAKDVVTLNLYAWKALVQLLADNDRDHAVAIIESAGFAVKTIASWQKPDLQVKAGAAPGTARLIAKAVGRKASYEWEQSTNGQNWVKLDSTPIANTLATGLLPATIYYFRARGNTSNSSGSWCDPVAYITL